MSNPGIVTSKSLKAVWISGLVCAVAAALLFSVWPELDLYSSSLFYEGEGRFILNNNPLGTIPRWIFKLLFIAFCAFALFGLLFSALRHRSLLGFEVPHWAFLVACLIIGPGILTNSILKDHWGRARPVQTEQFGSNGKFTPALIPSTACDHNCSFVSGESSSIFMMFFALALLLEKYRKRLLVAGIIIGGLSGLVRMGMGGHFLSDVAFSGIFMLLTASALYWLFFSRKAPRGAEVNINIAQNNQACVTGKPEKHC